MFFSIKLRAFLDGYTRTQPYTFSSRKGNAICIDTCIDILRRNNNNSDTTSWAK